MKKLSVIILLLIFTSCVDTEQAIEIDLPKTNTEVNDEQYVVDSNFAKGDVRRYGLLPDATISTNQLVNVMKLAKQGLPIQFPKGHFKCDIHIKGSSDISLHFNETTLTGSLIITNLDSIPSERIKLSGNLTILDRLYTRASNNILFDTVVVKTNRIKNPNHRANRGVSIYAGTKYVKFESLKIIDAGGDETDAYKHVAAALQIHGWNNNPESVVIHNLEIKNSARTGVYITGNNHRLGNVSVTNFGFGSTENMFGLEDAKKDEQRKFSGVWANICNDCNFESITIDSREAIKAKFSLRLGEGKAFEPTFIQNLKLLETNNVLPIEDHPLTNILVKRIARQ